MKRRNKNNGNIWKKSCGLLLFAALAAGITLGTGVKKAMAEEQKAAEKSYDVSRLLLPENAERLVVVEADGLSADVSMYARTEKDQTVRKGSGEALSTKASLWTLVTETDEGLIGRKGMGKTAEGDEKTPAGLYLMNTPFGTEKAQEGFPENYLQVDGRYYWDGDSASARYNKLVNTDEYTAFDRSKSEHLSTYGGVSYHYCIDTGYNFEGTPNRGSALFLHCSAGKNTAGCIAIPEKTMTEIMKNYKEGKTYILLDRKGNFEQYEDKQF